MNPFELFYYAKLEAANNYALSYKKPSRMSSGLFIIFVKPVINSLEPD